MKAEFLPPQKRSTASRTMSVPTDDKVIVSCGIGEPYREDFEVTVRNCNLHCGDAWKLYYPDYPDGCPTQAEHQYAFKIYALSEAIRAGFRYILWIDSSLAPIAPISPLWSLISKEGWYAAPQFNGITVGQPWRHWETNIEATLAEWCSDRVLNIFGVTREEAKLIPLVLTGLVGFDMGNPLSVQIWKSHQAFYHLGVFDGPHVNRPGQPITPVGRKFSGHVSDDPSVIGHRQDETSMSFVLYALGLKAIKRGYLTLEVESGFIGQFIRHFSIRYKGPRIEA